MVKETELNINPELIKLIRTLIPEQMAKDLVSVQPIHSEDIDMLELAKALDEYQWVCPILGAAFNKKDT